MNASESLIFKPLQEKDLNLLYHWFQEPVINRWYARGKAWAFADFHAVLVDPERTNHQAIRCYEKAGFIRTHCSEDKEHLILLKKLS